MRMMRRLFDNLTNQWSRLPKEKYILTLQKGTGTHGLLTVTNQQLHFHSLPYQTSLGAKQTIYLQDLTLEELVTQVQMLGYHMELTSEGQTYKGDSACTLLECADIPFRLETTLGIFTSKVWRFLYPFAQVLEEADNNTDLAIEQMFRDTSRGKWLDYWADFFHVKRLSGEADITLARRLFMTITNLKSNNIAMEELVRYVMQSEAFVVDVEPAYFEVQVDPELMQFGYNDAVHDIIRTVKGAGMDYTINYIKIWSEDFRSYLTDKLGMPYQQSDVMTMVLDGALRYSENLGNLLERYTVAFEREYAEASVNIMGKGESYVVSITPQEVLEALLKTPLERVDGAEQAWREPSYLTKVSEVQQLSVNPIYVDFAHFGRVVNPGFGVAPDGAIINPIEVKNLNGDSISLELPEGQLIQLGVVSSGGNFEIISHGDVLNGMQVQNSEDSVITVESLGGAPHYAYEDDYSIAYGAGQGTSNFTLNQSALNSGDRLAGTYTRYSDVGGGSMMLRDMYGNITKTTTF